MTRTTGMKIGLIHNRPGVDDLEFDLVRQITLLLEQWHHKVVVMDPLGNQLDGRSSQLIEGPQIDHDNLDFSLYLDYPTPKLIDTFSYVVNWTPLRYLVFDPVTGEPSQPEQINFVRNALLSHDHMLSASSPALDEFQYAQFGDTRWTPLMDDLTLHPGCRIFASMAPIELGDFKVCHVITNLMTTVEAKQREMLMQRLDSTGSFVFFDLGAAGNDKAENTPRSHRSNLPLDAGESIVKIFNRHGVALVLPTTAHQESALAPALLFHALAARSIVITAHNSFFREHFGDSVLTFEYSDDPDETSARIQEKIAWIRSHPQQAREKAEQAHRVFREHFSLDVELERIVDNHHKQLERLVDGFAKLAHKSVDAIFLCREEELEHIHDYFHQLQHSAHISVHGLVLVSPEQLSAAQQALESFQQRHGTLWCDIISIEGMQQQPAGALMHKALSEHAKGTFFAHWSPKIHWHYDHLANLALEIVNSNNLIAQSATSIRNSWFDNPTKGNAEVVRYSSMEARRLDGLLLLQLDKSRVEFASFLFHSALLYQNWPFMALLKHLDSCYPFLLILEHVKRYRRFPGYVPHYTTQHAMPDNLIPGKMAQPKPGDFRLTGAGRPESFTVEQQQTFLRGACSSSSDHDLLLSLLAEYRLAALIQDQLPGNGSGQPHHRFSRNGFMRSLLGSHSIPLRRWPSLFNQLKRILRP